MPRLRPLLSCLLVLALAVPVVRGELVWRPGEGWSDESGGDVSASSSRDQLEVAHKLEAEGQHDDALKAYKSLLRRWPLSFFSPEAQYRVGKIYEDQGDFQGAFKAFQVMVQKYPSSEYFEQALKEQYRIANLYLAGEPQRIWKIPLGPSMDRTVDMYRQVIKNAPYGTYAPQCEFNIGLARENQRKFTDAIESYQRVLDNYPGSPVAASAQYQIGYAWMRSSQSGDYDLGAAKKAVDAFQDFLVRYPASDKAEQAQENIQKLNQKQTQGAFDIAKFYESQHPPDPRAAFIYYNEVVREDANSPQAQVAKKRIQELRHVVEALPGGLGPDGTGSLAKPATVVSNPQSPISAAPDEGPPMPNTALPDPAANSALPADPNAPLTSSSPGETAAAAAAPNVPATAPAPAPMVPAPAPVVPVPVNATPQQIPDLPPAPSAPSDVPRTPPSTPTAPEVPSTPPVPAPSAPSTTPPSPPPTETGTPVDKPPATTP